MNYKIRQKLNKHQEIFLSDNTTKFLHLSGGLGSGKTHILCKKIMQLSHLNLDKPGGLVCPDYKDFKRDILPEMEKILEDNNIPIRFHKTDFYFTFPWTRAKLYVVSAEKLLRGPNWAYAGLNEVTLIPLVRYKEVVGRVRLKGAVVPQVVSVGTPEGFASEYYDYFIENPPPDLRVVYGSSDDNLENLHPDYLKNLENMFDKKMIDAYRKGLWVNMAGNQFYYSYDPAKQWNKELKPEKFQTYYIAMDFNVDPFCASIWGFDGFGIHGVGQVKLSGANGYDTKNMIQALMSRGYTPYNSIIFPDPAGRARSTKGIPDIKILEQSGYKVQVRKAAPSFRTRQLNVNNLLDKKRIQFNPDLMPDMRKDLEAVEQDKVTLEKKKDNVNLTHFSDGLDYMCDILFPFDGDRKSVTQVKYR